MDLSLINAIHRSPPVIAANALISEAIAAFAQTDLSVLVVIDPQTSEFVGLLTPQALLQFTAAEPSAATQCLARVLTKAATEQCLRVNESDLHDLDSVVMLFGQYQLSALPVLNDHGQPVGLITAPRLFQAFRPPDRVARQDASEGTSEGTSEGSSESLLPADTLRQRDGNAAEFSLGAPQQTVETVMRRQLTRARLLQKITDSIRSQDSAQHVFETTVTQVGLVFGVTHCYLFINTPTALSQLAVAATYSSVESSPLIDGLLADTPYLRQLLSDDRAIVSPNVYAEPLLQPMESLCQQIGLKSMLAVRTSYQGQPNGLLTLHQCDRFRQWSTSDIQLIEAIAAQVGIVIAQLRLLDREKQHRAAIERQNQLLQQEIRDRQAALYELQQAEERLELFFSQSLDGFFFMMLDQPVQWDDSSDKERILDYVFEHQRITKINDAMLQQYGIDREQSLGLTPSHFFAHDLKYGRQLWRQFFDAGKLHVETQEQRSDGTPVWIEGDYICLYDAQGKITGHFGIQRDVTARKRAEAELRHSEERWQLIVQASNDGIFDIDLTTGRGFYSERFKQMLGYGDQEFADTRDQWIELLHPDDRDRTIAAKAAYLNREIPQLTQEYRMRGKDGTYKWLFDRVLAVWDDNGQPLRVLGISTDISDRKQVEETLKRQQAFLRSVIDIPPNLIFAKDYNGHFVLANQATAEIYGTTVEDLIGKTDADFNPNLAEVELFLKDDRNVIQTGQAKLIEETVTSAAGETRCFQTIKTPIESLDGQSVFVLGIATDITDRKQSEATLAKRERYLAVLVEIQRLLLAAKTKYTHHTKILQQLGMASGASRVYLFENHYDAAGTLMMSQRAEWCAEGIIPQLDNPMLQNLSYPEFFPRWAELLPSGEAINGIVADFPVSERAVLEPQGVLSILILPLIVGNQFWGFIGFDNCVLAQPWDALELNLLSAAASAISLHQKRKQTEAALAQLLVQTQEQSIALEKARDAAEAANRAKTEFLSNMSHELRTPLNAILGFTQIMSHDCLLNAENQEYVNIINRSGQHLLTLINDVLEMSKIEAGRLKLHPISFDLHHLLDTIYDMLHLKASAKQLQLTFQRSPTLPQYITTDEGKLRQVLLNLVGNAIKFTHRGGVFLRITERHSPENSAAAGSETRLEAGLNSGPGLTASGALILRFEIEDTGPGIAADDLESLFKPFMQTPIGRQSTEGTGLGLTISQKFVQLMGGHITVDSVVDQGCIFRFAIEAKLAQAVLPAIAYSGQRVVSLAAQHPRYRLLIVEDYWENQQILVKLLQPVGFDVKVASNGQEGIAIWEHWRPQVILMDMRMPVMSGYEATRQIRAKEALEFTMAESGTVESGTVESGAAESGTAAGKTASGDGTPRATKIIAVTSSAFDEERSAILEMGCDDFISKPFREEEIFAKLAHHLDIRYVYENKQGLKRDGLARSGLSRSVSLASGLALESSAFEGIALEWIVELHRAAILGKDSQMLKLIEELPSTHAALGRSLQILVSDFRFEEIVELTQSLGL
ncbi:MAG TPA: PAS domain S-box protein [Chroococcidiopsis sp.]